MIGFAMRACKHEEDAEQERATAPPKTSVCAEPQPWSGVVTIA